MINSKDSIRFANVISKKYRFNYKDMNIIMDNFINDVVKQNVTIKGPFFYSINNVPMDEVIIGEFFMPVKEEKVNIVSDMYFHSYFSIEDMVSYCLFSNFKNETEVAYKILLDYIEQNNLLQVTPIFHVASGDRTLQYAFIKIGVIKNEN